MRSVHKITLPSRSSFPTLSLDCFGFPLQGTINRRHPLGRCDSARDVKQPILLVAFDLDGTLLRGDTVCLALATQLGKRERMQEMERLTARDDIAAAREEMAAWYRGVPIDDLCASLAAIPLAPGTREAFQLLKQHQIETAIVSITWDFAVASIANNLGADHFVGTQYQADGPVGHFWPEDKPRWLQSLASGLDLSMDQLAAVGDSASDLPMLRAVGRPIYIGHTRPTGLDHLLHCPNADVLDIARDLIGEKVDLG